MRENDNRPDDRLKVLLQAIELFRDDGRTVSALHIAVFLTIATRSPIRVGEVAQLLDVPLSSVSTALTRLLSSEHVQTSKGQPLGLVQTEQHPEDRRARIASLTTAGRHLVLGLRDVLAERA